LRAATLIALVIVIAWAMPALGHQAKDDGRLSKIGPAADFTLTTQHGERLSLGSLRGKVIAVTFIYATCVDTCPLLTAKLVGLQKRLGQDFGSRVMFVAVTVDPERDTPEVLRRYAEAHRARLDGWAFLTGTPDEIREVARRYGIYVRKNPRGDVDHTFLTSIVDPDGILRVQYLGTRFDPGELLRDLRSLLQEGKPTRAGRAPPEGRPR
jgi:protein SCO1